MVGQFDKLTGIPGYQHIPELLSKTRQTFEEKINPRDGPEKVSMFINSFNSLVFYFLEACPARTERQAHLMRAKRLIEIKEGRFFENRNRSRKLFSELMDEGPAPRKPVQF
jgi:hypothetical protein